MPITNLNQFNVALDTAIKRHKKDGIKFQKVVALEVLRRVVLKTPVDTGRARGNWQAAIGQPVESSLDVEDKNGGPTVQAGTAVIVGLKDFATVHVSNNLSYILALENGTPHRAPVGMVAVTLQELETQL